MLNAIFTVPPRRFTRDGIDPIRLYSEFRQFISAMSVGEDGVARIEEGKFFYITELLPGFDFNREIVRPNINPAYPEGVMGIRVDGNFYPVAALPAMYIGLPLQTVVRTLWPCCVDQATYAADVFATP